MSVSRSTPGGAAYLDLQQARASGRPVQELLQLYVLDVFLDRRTRSTLRDVFALKGGALLAAYGQRQATPDTRHRSPGATGPRWSGNCALVALAQG